jgi:hypothetical protein
MEGLAFRDRSMPLLAAWPKCDKHSALYADVGVGIGLLMGKAEQWRSGGAGKAAERRERALVWLSVDSESHNMLRLRVQKYHIE